ncbi:hypothetical protein [Verrucosispora sp. WMMC514]|uniref:hypothetical protein n=1 Tax=Verrucosispora sp. WMMC514 TaxID=3015156 RepID=UPI00248C76B2|nr:hypothetical protein [Verrucosispora sp. WMMC514]WBB93429.1 hypothetical protein O7597_10840 [Verrucosispora sp. WMMC514]
MVLVAHFAIVGLDEADKLASSIGAVVALVALGAPYLLPPPSPQEALMPAADLVEGSGKATATGGGQANTGLRTSAASRTAQVIRSGDATADGPTSVANTGIQRGIRP